MCGIVGHNHYDPVQIKKLNDLLTHRGPDDGGFYADDLISMAQRRLSILDLSEAGHQPMFYSAEKGASSEKYLSQNMSDAQLAIVFNGEIYNYIEIRDILAKKSYKFTTQCDTELIMAAYLEFGENCFQMFNGMWALCIYDLKKKSLILSRDRMGIKPLYFYSQDSYFAFASEMKPFFFMEKIQRKIDLESLEHYLILNFSPKKKTILQNIQKLDEGSWMQYDLQKKEIVNYQKFWNLSYKVNNLYLNDYTHLLLLKIEESVKRRLLADVPVGAFLSGGVDSSSIVYFMKLLKPDLKTFSVSFDYADFDESQYSQKISRLFSTDHYEVKFNSGDVANLIDELPYYFDEPFADVSMVPTCLVSKVAAEHVKVCLSGTGADELFGGYNHHREFLTLNRLFNLPKIVKSPLTFFYSFVNKDRANKLKQLLEANSSKVLYLKLFSHLYRNNNDTNIKPGKFSYLNDLFLQESAMNNILEFDQKVYLTEDLLVKEDRATMKYGLEGRVPFIDFEIVQLANAMPEKMKIHGSVGKFILKKAMESKLPNDILYRKKQGFGVPIKHYFRKELKDFAYDRIFPSKLSEYFDDKKLKELWDIFIAGKSDYAAFFWNLMMINLWSNKWKITL